MNSSTGNDRSERCYDIVIFAASSSVGQFLVEELALVVDKQYPTSSVAGNENNKSVSPSLRRKSVPSSIQMGGGIRWAIAGRSAVRLNETLGRAELNTGIRELAQQVPILLADLNRHDSLRNLCKQTHLVINCAGPYLEYGAELLVKASIECKTNYLDLSHETTFIELIRREYSEAARRAGVFIIQGCGFQSMSSELGLNFTKQVADGQIDRVKIILALSDSRANRRSIPAASLVSPAMWQSLLADKAQEVPGGEGRLSPPAPCSSALQIGEEKGEQSTNNNDSRLRHLERKDTQTLVKDIIQFRNRNSLSFWWPPVRLVQNTIIKILSLVTPGGSQLAQDNLVSDSRTGYTWPINCITSDECQLIKSEMSNYELRGVELHSQTGGWRPIQCSNFISLGSFTELCYFCLWLFFFQILVKFSFARRLMRSFPRLATLDFVSGTARETSHSGYSLATGSSDRFDRAALSHLKFSQTFLAYGTPSDDSGNPLESRDKGSKRRCEQLLVSRVVGPEPNHVATATYAIQAALTLLLEKEHLPRSASGQLGGVLTPGVAFAETNIIYQLRKRNIKFEVLKKA